MEDKKKLGMILTIVAVLLCGCPGLCALSGGVLFATGRSLGAEVTGNPEAFAIPMICVGLLGILLTIGAGVYWFMQSRKVKEDESLEDIEVPDPIE